jgi:hypothetical protein
MKPHRLPELRLLKQRQCRRCLLELHLLLLWLLLLRWICGVLREGSGKNLWLVAGRGFSVSDNNGPCQHRKTQFLKRGFSKLKGVEHGVAAAPWNVFSSPSGTSTCSRDSGVLVLLCEDRFGWYGLCFKGTDAFTCGCAPRPLKCIARTNDGICCTFDAVG